MKKIQCSILIIMLTGLFIVLSSCGYQLEGGGYLDNNITKVAVSVFENKSSETGAGLTFTNAMVQEILQKTDTVVVDVSLADHIIEGRVDAITFSTLSRSTTDSVLERKVSAIVDLKIKNKDGDVIWSAKNFSSDEDYTVSSDVTADDANKRAAVDKIAIRSAERLVSKMLNNF